MNSPRLFEQYRRGGHQGEEEMIDYSNTTIVYLGHPVIHINNPGSLSPAKKWLNPARPN
jgi:hypothetical protein